MLHIDREICFFWPGNHFSHQLLSGGPCITITCTHNSDIKEKLHYMMPITMFTIVGLYVSTCTHVSGVVTMATFVA